MSARRDKSKAATTAAHKVARLICTMLTRGEDYTDQGQKYIEVRYRERVVRQPTKKARELELDIIPAAQVTQPS